MKSTQLGRGTPVWEALREGLPLLLCFGKAPEAFQCLEDAQGMLRLGGHEARRLSKMCNRLVEASEAALGQAGDAVRVGVVGREFQRAVEVAQCAHGLPLDIGEIGRAGGKCLRQLWLQLQRPFDVAPRTLNVHLRVRALDRRPQPHTNPCPQRKSERERRVQLERAG